jgi:DNA-binding transcriptional MerR regulator
LNQDQISKKDLLELTNISYGQLYRWKRKNLIPEDWFIRKATFTGQETFFPKQKVLERIEKIQELKESLSLDELAEMFSPNETNVKLNKQLLQERNIVSETVLQLFSERIKDLSEFQFEQTLEMYVVEKLLQSGNINLDEAKMIIQLFQDSPFHNKSNSELIILRKLGVTTCFIVTSFEEIFVEKGTKVIERLSFFEIIEDLKSKLL